MTPVFQQKRERKMNIDELTIGQAKELASMFGGRSLGPSDMYNSYIGKYVIVRSRNEGINFGEVKALDQTGIVLKNARRLWHHAPADKNVSWYEGVAQTGLSDDSQVSGFVTEKAIIEDYSITVCTDIAKESVERAVANAQS